LWSEVPVVFYGVDEVGAAQLNLPPNVTGFVAHQTFRGMVDAARVLVPGFKRVALVGDPPGRDTYRRNYGPEIATLAAEVELIDLTGLAVTEVKKRVAVLPNDAMVFYTAIFVDGAGVVHTPQSALLAIAGVTSRPIITDVESQLGYGAVGGFVFSLASAAREAERLAVRILSGENASQIPVAKIDLNKPIFDGRELKRWNISEDRLPPGSEIRFRELTAWDQYRWQIMLVAAALLVQTSLIIGLFYEHRHRRIAEAASRGAMGRLAHMNRIATAGELSASIAHEVNQPLAAIVANANAGLRFLAGATPDLDEARAVLESVVSDGHRAGEVVGSVRAMFKKDSEEKAPLDLNDLIQDILGLVRGELQTQGIIVQTGLSRALPLVLGNGGQLQQVILNLVRNGADAMGSVSGRARVLGVNSAVHDPDGVLVSVEDSGTGIDPKNIERIFESFYNEIAGHGDGAFDLSVDYRSPSWPPLGFTRCRSWRGFQRPVAGGQGRGRIVSAQSDTESVVFIIDDDESLRVALKRLFRSVGLQTEVFASAPEFLQSNLPDVPSCLVLDVRLPGVSGLDFQAELGNAHIHIPIVFITGHGDIPMSVRAMKAGAVEFLTKPLREQDLLDAVREALDRDRIRREQQITDTDLRARFESLTPREREVMAFVTAGLMNKQVASAMDVAEITVKFHRGHIMRKMGASSLADLVRMADSLGVRPSK
jgi:FixJ family two-component response regulator/signal transduction histidine kinase